MEQNAHLCVHPFVTLINNESHSDGGLNTGASKLPTSMFMVLSILLKPFSLKLLLKTQILF
jgi:hypothetical protein